MSAFSERIKEVRESLGMNKSEFALFLNTNVPNITRYEREDMGVSMDAVEKIAKKVGVSPGWLLGWDNEKYPKETVAPKRIPVLGVIAAGAPILAQENIEEYVYVPEKINADFCLKIKGDSMIGARILDGDIVFIKKQPTIENGEIAAVLVDSEEATLKRVFINNDTIILHAENPNYADLVFTRKDMRQINIIGKAILLQSEVR